MKDFEQHIISPQCTVREVLARLDELASDASLFLVDEQRKLLGSLTDGDVRRGLIRGLGLEDEIIKFVKREPKFLRLGDYSIETLQDWRAKSYKIIPVVNEAQQIVEVINLRVQQSRLPIDAVIMAGGNGTRLRPLTLNTPKPLIKVGDKPIVEYNIDRLQKYGIRNITLSIAYLGQQLIDYFGDGSERGLNIKYVTEEKPLGTIGAVRQIEAIHNDYVLVMNSDLLTNIDFEDMLQQLLQCGGEMIVATSPYEVKVPYGVIETEGQHIRALREKPTYTYYSNAGIYIFKREHIDLIPARAHFNATDLMEALYSNGKKVIHYPILGYWLDIGKPQDYEKAQQDIKHLKL